jgi:hypothetical protein
MFLGLVYEKKTENPRINNTQERETPTLSSILFQ